MKFGRLKPLPTSSEGDEAVWKLIASLSARVTDVDLDLTGMYHRIIAEYPELKGKAGFDKSVIINLDTITRIIFG